MDRPRTESVDTRVDVIVNAVCIVSATLGAVTRLPAKHKEDQFLVKVVENLVRNLLREGNHLVAVPMNLDPETPSTYALLSGTSRLRNVLLLLWHRFTPPFR
jgi:hypothetical protein